MSVYEQSFDPNSWDIPGHPLSYKYRPRVSLLPRGPLSEEFVRPHISPPVRRTSVRPTRRQPEARGGADRNGDYTSVHSQRQFWTTPYAEQLRQQARDTRIAQENWLVGVEVLRQEQEEEELARRRLHEQERAERRARELQQQARDVEERARALEAAIRQRVEREAERRHLQIIYEQQQEEQRRQALENAARRREEEERVRRERERECMACSETSDLDMGEQLACTHWYCHDCVQGEEQ